MEMRRRHFIAVLAGASCWSLSNLALERFATPVKMNNVLVIDLFPGTDLGPVKALEIKKMAPWKG